jgi:hypothetical protein
MDPRYVNPGLMTLGDALGHIAVAAAAGWLLRRVDLLAALRVTGHRLPAGVGQRIERAAADAAAAVWREAGRLGIETAPYQEIASDEHDSDHLGR